MLYIKSASSNTSSNSLQLDKPTTHKSWQWQHPHPQNHHHQERRNPPSSHKQALLQAPPQPPSPTSPSPPNSSHRPFIHSAPQIYLPQLPAAAHIALLGRGKAYLPALSKLRITQQKNNCGTGTEITQEHEGEKIMLAVTGGRRRREGTSGDDLTRKFQTHCLLL